MNTATVPNTDNTDNTANTREVPATAKAGSTAGNSRAATSPIRFHHLLHGEWIKFRSVRSAWGTLVAAGFVTVAFGMIFAATAGSGDAAPGPAATLTDPLSLALGALNLSQLIVGVMGALVVASEFSTGLIRTSVASAGRRVKLLGAKAVVVGGATAVVMGISVTLAAWLGQMVYAGDAATLAMNDPDLIGVLVGSTAYATGVALLGMAFAYLMRSTAAAIGVLFGFVFIGPGLLSLLPDSFTDVVLKYLPSEAGGVLMTRVADPDMLSTTWAAVVFAGWVFGLLGVAAVLLKSRDV
jgi:ABC-type transport system involved in multi-copper enzyme maturation permease subunit